MTDLEPRERFLKIYANLPIPVREEIVAAIPTEENEAWKPITWNVAFIEIKNNTDLGKKILQYLEELKII